MNLRIIAVDFVYNIKAWMRSRGTVFWSLLFPVMLILLFGAIFSGLGEAKYTLYVQDLDDTSMSHMLIDMIKKTGIVDVKNVSTDKPITDYIKERNIKNLLVIPSGYQEIVNGSFMDDSVVVNITYYYDPAEQQTNQVLDNVISNIIHGLNMRLTNSRSIINVKHESTITEEYGFIDFFIPGMIGFTIMQQSIYGSIERNTKYRKDGILRKLQTTPITRYEWILAKMLFMLFLAFISTTVSITVGVLAFGVKVNINLLSIIVIVATSFLFSGVGMIIGRFVKEEETADMAAGAISFPMMFLAGTFFAVDAMPPILQGIARVLPLYYVNEGLRSSMIYSNESPAILDAVIVLVFACVFFVLGVLVTRWKED